MNFGLTGHMMLASGALVSCAAAVVFYLGCPNQQWLYKRRYSFYTGLASSLLLLVMALVLICQVFSLLAAVFVVVQLVSLFIGIIPFCSRITSPNPSGPKKKPAVTKSVAPPTASNRWFWQICSGILLGMPLAVGVCGWIVWAERGLERPDDQTQFVMWSTALVWLLIMSFIFFIKRQKHLLLSLTGANAFVYGVLWVLKGGV